MATQDQGAAEPKPTVSYQDHDHHLSVIEEGLPNPSHLPICTRCKGKICGGPYFCCPRCPDFHLHLHCGPLPLTIKTQFHLHPLELADTVVEDDSGEYYCEACEEPRDPRECVYYCSTCEYISHLKCVRAEVASTLKGEFGDVELRTVGDRVPGRVVAKDNNGKSRAEGAADPRGGSKEEEGGRTLKEVYSSLSEDELNQLRELCPLMEPGSGDDSEAVFDKGVIRYSDEDFRRLLRDLDSATISLEKLLDFFDMELRVAPLQGQEVPVKFSDTWRQLTNKFGTFGARSELSEGVKIFVATLLCQVVWEMSNTGLNDVTEEKLGSWWKKLRVVSSGGFRVQFAIEHLKKVVCACFGREATRFAMTKAAQVGEEAARIEAEISSLQKKLEELKAQRKLFESILDSSVMKKCLAEASAFGLGRASKGLIP